MISLFSFFFFADVNSGNPASTYTINNNNNNTNGISFNVQAIKQKLQINRNKALTSTGERASPQEEDKAKMLFGNRHAVS